MAGEPGTMALIRESCRGPQTLRHLMGTLA